MSPIAPTNTMITIIIRICNKNTDKQQFETNVKIFIETLIENNTPMGFINCHFFI